MTQPFMALHALLCALVGPVPVARFLEPVLGDIHAEYAEARTPHERRRVVFRGLVLLLRSTPHLLVRPARGSLLSLATPLSALAMLGILGLLREPSVAPLARSQAVWLALAWISALGFAVLARSKHGARAGSLAALGLLGLSMMPSTVLASAHLYATLGLPVEPLKLAVPFVLLLLLSSCARLRTLGTWLLVGIGTVASARGALTDACFAWTMLAVVVDTHTRWLRLAAPLALVATFAPVAPVSLTFEPHTDGMLRGLRFHGGAFGGLLAMALAVWTVESFVRCRVHSRVAVSVALGFAATVVLAALASHRLLPYEVASVLGLSYGGSSLFMLLGAAGALAGSRADQGATA